MLYRTILIAFLLSMALSCRSSNGEPVQTGGPTSVSGTGVIAAGNVPENLVIISDVSGETYCLIGEFRQGMKVDDHVTYEGQRYTALPLKDEDCLRLDLTQLSSTDWMDLTR